MTDNEEEFVQDLRSALANLSRVARQYVAEGIPEVDDAIEEANDALVIHWRNLK